MSVPVQALQEALSALPEGWRVESVNPGSLYVYDPRGLRYGYVFTDDRPTLLIEPGQRDPGDQSSPAVRALVLAGYAEDPEERARQVAAVNEAGRTWTPGRYRPEPQDRG